MSAGKAPADKPKVPRLPAPSLFIGPPSRNASNISLHPQAKEGHPTSATRDPLNRQRSLLGEKPRTEKSEGPISPNDALSPGVFGRRQPQQTSKAEQQSNERTDALWAEMQNTLEEVELSATSGTHVFGPNHSKALEELRTAQIALAQAWAKSEAEEESQNTTKSKDAQDRPMSTADVLSSERTEKFGQTATDIPNRSGTGGSADTGKSQLEEETENDIALARKRREANDRYFQRVNTGVVDVVRKLEEVAKAMKGVEMESKEIWDKESIETASIT
jgi:hypothetical protein